MSSSAPNPTSAGPASPPELPEHTAMAVYRAREVDLRSREAALQREHIRLGYVQLAFGLALVVLLLPPIPPALLPLAAFFLASRAHSQVLRRLAETRRALLFYEHAQARVDDRWAGRRPRQTRLNLADSLYAADLDLFGPGSLFELLCEARSSLGEDTLAAWLLAPGTVQEALARQHAVTDLRARTALRETFAAAAGPAVVHLDRHALAAWAEAPAHRLPPLLQWVAPALVVCTLLAAARYAAVHSPVLLMGMLIVDASLTFAYRRVFGAVFPEAERAQRALRTAAALLRAIEQQTFTAPRLQTLQGRLRSLSRSASQALAQLAGLGQWADARGNYVVRLLDAPFLYSLQLALALERWRSHFGPQLGLWLDVLGEFEALLSLAAYSFEHPDDPFPCFTPGPASFRAEQLGHPLLPATTCVRNSLAIGDGARLLLVSGSNMSGKSTLLRSVGVNTVLAFAGAPVRARSLVLSPLTVAASIHVNDSLLAGRSRFYAEILRLRAIVEAARTHPPVLFLLDELLAGTNSADRLAGAHGLVRELLQAGAIGLLSTHDLALTSLAPDVVSLVRNVHFQDEVVDGKLTFDHTLRDGAVSRSNGLALMRLIGLNV